MKKDYGKIALTPGGLWDANTPYEKLTTVSRNGQGYLSFEDNQGVDPEQDCDPTTGIGTKWFRIATKGDPGTTDYNELINKPFIPTALKDLTDDTTHRTVTDVEKSTWNDKTDKVSNATNGNLAGLDGNGNLTDSGKKASDFATAAQGAKADTALDQLAIIAALIPEQASSENQLGDKAFINSSIQTNTAEFKGTRNLVTDLSLTTSATQQQIAAALASAISSADNNDYCFVQIPTNDATPTQIARVDRYKYNGSAWLFEWSLNNSSFTAEQWAAINSTVTSGDVDKLRLLPTKAQLDTLLTAKQDKLVNSVNIKSINYQSLLGSGNLDISDVFIADYGSTSLSEIEAAYSSGKVIVARAQVMRGNGFFILTQVDYEYDPMGAYIFTTLVQDQLMWFSLGSINGYTPISGFGINSEIAAKYTKPSSGIPASDIAAGVIPDVSQFITKSVNDLVNYYTKSETYTQSEVNALIGSIQHFHYEIYASLQDITTPASNVLYLIGPSGSGSDKYEEYVYANSDFKKIGDTSIDLSNYVTTQALNSALQQFAQNLQTELNNYVLKSQIKSINGYSLIGNGNIDTQEVFVGKYMQTSYEEISIACYNYQSIWMETSSNPEDKFALSCNLGSGNGGFVFYRIKPEQIEWVTLDDLSGYSRIYSLDLQSKLTFDNVPTSGSTNPVTSDGIKTALDNKQDALVSGTNIKTINSTSLLSSGNLTLEDSSNKTNDIANNDTDTTKYPSCKAVADYVSGIVGDINSILETI